MKIRRPPLSTLSPIGFLALLVVLFLVFQGSESPPVVESTSIVPSRGIWDVYFSQPTNPTSRSLRGGPDAHLVEAIDLAQFSVDMAMYHLDLWSVRDALIRAHRRGVVVQVVTDDSYQDEPEIQALRDAGIPVVDDHRPGIMHHKFFVIDRDEIWTGSMNMTINGAYRNDNHLIRVRSKEVAENYTREFDEMFLEDRFGALSLADTPYPVVDLDGTRVEMYFSPDDGVLNKVMEQLQKAERRVEILAYALTTDTIGEVLIDLHQDGVAIRGVVEASQSQASGSETPRLRQSGMDIRLDGNPENMHHKVILIDGVTVIMGSYNFTRSAEEKNDENVIIFHDPALAAQFLIEFERVYENATP
jgi:phosphatidylserine/phosphatidylglycerophosphate/cardiolipin synthase-like enzyme